MKLRALGLYCGIASPLIWLFLIGLGGALRPDFNHVTHFISELGERGSSTEFMMRYAGFILTGLLYVCFAGALADRFRGDRLALMASALIALDGLGRIGAGIFPCDPGCGGLGLGQELHRLAATVGFVCGILAALGWSLILYRRQRPRLARHALASGVSAAALLMLMSWPAGPPTAAGLYEHLASAVLSLWMGVLAASVLQGERSARD